MIDNTYTFHIKLDNFEGTLDFLAHLIQKSEIDLYEISIRHLIEQFLSMGLQHEDAHLLDRGAEFIGTTAHLIALKSKKLLPKHEQEETEEPLEADPKFSIIHQLIEYCRFKEVAKELSQMEAQQTALFPRGAPEPDPVKKLGIEHLSLDDLQLLFQGLLARAPTSIEKIHEETWKVSDKIRDIRHRLKAEQEIAFAELFAPTLYREELIVLFLAILELMKLGDISVCRAENTGTVYLTFGEGKDARK